MRKKPSPPSIAGQIEKAAFKHSQIEYLPVDQLIPYKSNPRLHTDRNIDEIAGSIRRLGFWNPCLIDANNVIISGHGRIEAAKRIGLAAVPVIRVENLTDDEVRALRIADNRIAELSDWSEEVLAIELQYLVEVNFDGLNAIGFEGPQIDFRIEEQVKRVRGGEDIAAEAIPALQKDAVSRLGDIWVFDEKHRLLCGSALDPANYDLLLEGRKADLILQDLPGTLK